jgi:pilus assembly protein CpaE
MDQQHGIRTALITTDPAFRTLVRQLFAGPGIGTPLSLDVDVPVGRFGEAQVHALRALTPDLLILDLENDPALGIQLAQHLADSNPAQRVIVAGPALESDLLLAAMRAGAVDFLPKPVTEDALRHSYERTQHKLTKPAGEKARQPGQIFAVFSPKGGAGATVLATNFAIVLHRLTGKKTLVVDLDLELGEVAVVLGVQPRFNFVDFVENFRRMDAGLLASYIERHESGVHLLSAPFQPEKAETVTADQIRRILAFLRQHYDYVIVDTPRSFSPTTLAAFEQADLAFLVTVADLPSIRNIQRGLPLLRRVLGKGDEQIRLIVNRYHANDAIGLKDIERTLGIRPFATIGNDYEAVASSVMEGKPIVLNGTSAFSRDVKALATQVSGVKPEGKKREGLAPFKGLFKAVRRSKEE